jgi:hypothetical protein
MSINPNVARVFVKLWTERYPKCIREFPHIIGGEYVRPLVSQVARDFSCTPKEAYQVAQELRAIGIRLATKEDEPRYEKREAKDFNWVKFGELLIRTKCAQTVCNAFDLSDDEFIRLCGIMTKAGIRLPKIKFDASLPKWLTDRMHLALHPHKYTPEETRTIGAKYRVARPKNKKTYYYNGTGCYRPKGQQSRAAPNKFRRMGASERSRLLNME